MKAEEGIGVVDNKAALIGGAVGTVVLPWGEDADVGRDTLVLGRWNNPMLSSWYLEAIFDALVVSS